MDIRSKVIEIIADQAIVEPSDLTDESTLESLGIDSLGLVESIFAIEEAFNIQIPFNANQPNESPLDLSGSKSPENKRDISSSSFNPLLPHNLLSFLNQMQQTQIVSNQMVLLSGQQEDQTGDIPGADFRKQIEIHCCI